MSSFDLARLQQQLDQASSRLPPIEQWDPPFCGNIDMVIKHDGSWHYMGSPIGRMALVKLFASVLKRQDDDYFLVTPVEKVGIQVIDAPFLITQWQYQDGQLMLSTNLDEQLLVSPANPLTLRQDKVSGDLLPYALVRRNLWARLHQNVFYQLVDIAEHHSVAGKTQVSIQSGGQQFSLGSY